MIQLVGLSGSLRRGSYNSAVLRVAAATMPPESELSIESIAGIPLYNGDDEAEKGVPDVVSRLKDAIAAADGLLLVTPEYNNSIPGVTKNAIGCRGRRPTSPACFEAGLSPSPAHHRAASARYSRRTRGCPSSEPWARSCGREADFWCRAPEQSSMRTAKSLMRRRARASPNSCRASLTTCAHGTKDDRSGSEPDSAAFTGPGKVPWWWNLVARATQYKIAP